MIQGLGILPQRACWMVAEGGEGENPLHSPKMPGRGGGGVAGDLAHRPLGPGSCHSHRAAKF